MRNKKNQEDKVVFLPLGIALGISTGVFFNEISIGLCFGILIGVIADYVVNQNRKK